MTARTRLPAMTAPIRLPVLTDEITDADIVSASREWVEESGAILGLTGPVPRSECREWVKPCRLYRCRHHRIGHLAKPRTQRLLFGNTNGEIRGARETTQLRNIGRFLEEEPIVDADSCRSPVVQCVGGGPAPEPELATMGPMHAGMRCAPQLGCGLPAVVWLYENFKSCTDPEPETWCALSAIERHGDFSAEQIADYFGISKMTAHTVIDPAMRAFVAGMQVAAVSDYELRIDARQWLSDTVNLPQAERREGAAPVSELAPEAPDHIADLPLFAGVLSDYELRAEIREWLANGANLTATTAT